MISESLKVTSKKPYQGPLTPRDDMHRARLNLISVCNHLVRATSPQVPAERCHGNHPRSTLCYIFPGAASNMVVQLPWLPNNNSAGQGEHGERSPRSPRAGAPGPAEEGLLPGLHADRRPSGGPWCRRHPLLTLPWGPPRSLLDPSHPIGR